MNQRRDEFHPSNEPPQFGPAPEAEDKDASARKFLGIWFECCHAYGRLHRNRQGTKFEGRCPRCGAKVQALIGTDGSSRRIFRAS